jgi:hypothetical protein
MSVSLARPLAVGTPGWPAVQPGADDRHWPAHLTWIFCPAMHTPAAASDPPACPVDSPSRLREHPGMTIRKRKRPDQQPPEDDTALLTAALNHSWTWYDEHMKRVFQLVNFYLVATALLVTAYANSINRKQYSFAIALAIVGLVLTAIASASALNQATAGGKAQDALSDMEDRIARRLDADSIRIVERQGGIRFTRPAAGIMVGLGAGLFVAALIYAAVQ